MLPWLALLLAPSAALLSDYKALITQVTTPNKPTVSPCVDVILSSGFCCFSSHAGFLDALEASPWRVPSAMVGTSSGSLAASIYLASGCSADAVAAELSASAPLRSCRPSRTPWCGVLSTRALERRLARVLPPTFEDLPAPLAVGVFDARTGAPRLVASGDLVKAVAASCAVPRLFSPVTLADGRYLDGGKKDRTALAAYRAWRPGRDHVVHLVKAAGAPLEPRDGVDAEDRVVRTPRAAAQLWSLGDFAGERTTAMALATERLQYMYMH